LNINVNGYTISKTSYFIWERQMPKPFLDFVFNPASIAIVGVSPDAQRPNIAQFYVSSLRDFGFKGNIYPIHPQGGEIFGMQVYKNVRDIPGTIDLVVSAIPAKFTPQLVEDCNQKGVKAMHLFTSGYSEIEDEIGKQLESEILRLAKKSGMRMVGPNCMGIYNPSAGVTFAGEFPPEQTGFPRTRGSLALLSQSGGNCISFIREADSRGLFFSKAISYGNAADLNECDYIEYMMEDPQTKVIAAYIEGVKDGSRFINVLKAAVARKPVVINKAGNTEIGARACASHTSAIAGSASVWHDLLKQVGAVQVGSMSELADVALAFDRIPLPHGRNVAVIGTGGGIAVQAADDITREGLSVPVLPAEVRQKLNSIYGTEAGSMFRNPVDMPPFGKTTTHVEAIKAIADSDHVDIIMMQFPFDLWALIKRNMPAGPFIEVVTELKKTLKKPLVVVLHYAASTGARRLADEVQARFVNLGLPVYPSIPRASSAIRKYIEFNERRK
jgi:acyl-CoA synthetase (NDP forming)